jgi:TatD DNase family protein
MTIIDTHAHLYDFPNADDVLRDSAAAGVSDVVALGVDLASSKKHIEIVEQLQNDSPPLVGGGRGMQVHLALGLHPGNIQTDHIDATFLFFLEELRRFNLRSSNIVAIGEAGLDFWYKWVRQDDAKKNEQRVVFQRHLDLAREFDLPIVVHCRGAWRESLGMIKAAHVKKAVFHWYSGPVDVLKDILDAGFLISGSLALEYSPEARQAVEYAQIDRILVETDTPVRGATPKDVWRSFKALCQIKGIDEDKALAVVNANARAFFNIEE